MIRGGRKSCPSSRQWRTNGIETPTPKDRGRCRPLNTLRCCLTASSRCLQVVTTPNASDCSRPRRRDLFQSCRTLTFTGSITRIGTSGTPPTLAKIRCAIGTMLRWWYLILGRIYIPLWKGLWQTRRSLTRCSATFVDGMTDTYDLYWRALTTLFSIHRRHRTHNRLSLQ